MVNPHEVKQQLRTIKADFRFWGRAEVQELPRILFEGENIHHAINGRYEGGFALLCATDRRVLLVDKKPFYLTLEDIRYDMISDVAYNHRLLDATVRLGTVHKSVGFTGYNHAKLRELTNFIQQQVMVFRQQQQQPQPQPVFQQAFDTSSQTAMTMNPMLTMLAPPQQAPPMNPYSAPLMIRRRVSRFY